MRRNRIMPDHTSELPPERQPNPYADKIEAVRQLLKEFNFERYVYVILATVAVLMILAVAGVTLFNGSANWELAGVFFGSGGLFTFSSGRLLSVFNKAWDVVFYTT